MGVEKFKFGLKVYCIRSYIEIWVKRWFNTFRIKLYKNHNLDIIRFRSSFLLILGSKIARNLNKDICDNFDKEKMCEIRKAKANIEERGRGGKILSKHLKLDE